MRIAFFEEIFARYSQLDFTHPTDRPLGMAGIESRFTKIFGQARYGILDDPRERSYLRRSLLWRRADLTKEMTKIDYPLNSRVLSWSWMAVTGSICFMDIPFGAVDWKPDLDSPFDNHGTPGALRGDARDFDKQETDRVFFDRSPDADWFTYSLLKCVVLGMQNVSNGCLLTHYGLLVAAAETGSDVYERVGVAAFERDQTWMDQQYVERIRVM